MNWEQVRILASVAGGLWVFYAIVCIGSYVGVPACGPFDPVEAKAKAVLTLWLSLAVLALATHWVVALAVGVLAFVFYFQAQKHYRKR